MSVPFARMLVSLSCLVLAIRAFSGAAEAGNIEDLLTPDRFVKELKAEPAQRDVVTRASADLAEIVRDYRWERGRLTSEALAWEGQASDLKALHDLRKQARGRIDAVLDSLKTNLSPKQIERLEKLRKKGNLLQVDYGDVPFAHINNTPLFSRSYSRARAYAVTLPVQSPTDLPPGLQPNWRYADYLHLWSVRSFLPSLVQTSTVPDLGTDLAVRDLSTLTRERMVQSPLLVSATLVTPGLAASEIDLLAAHHYPEANRDSLRAAYVRTNRLDTDILIRVKMSTPYAPTYLDLNRWIIYLEDDREVGYEPRSADIVARRPIEALEISLPGQQVEVTDVFGNYYPYIPGNREVVLLRGPSRVVYTGNEQLVKLYFPGRTFQGEPVISERTRSLRLIIKSDESRYGEAVLRWEFKGERPQKPPKRKGS